MSKALAKTASASRLAVRSAVRLRSGHSMPRLGFGIMHANTEMCAEAVKAALAAGYRNFDVVQDDPNGALVVDAVAEARLARGKVFITTQHTHPSSIRNTRKFPSLGATAPSPYPGGDYVDLFLLQRPLPSALQRAHEWHALLRAQADGRVRDIGVSNFDIGHLVSLPDPLPAVNQIEVHPWNQQRRLVEYCQRHGIVVQAYCPLARAGERHLNDPTVVGIAVKHAKTVPHVLLRWSLQKGFVPLAASMKKEHIVANADIYNFELDEEDMARIETLDKGEEGAVWWTKERAAALAKWDVDPLQNDELLVNRKVERVTHGPVHPHAPPPKAEHEVVSRPKQAHAAPAPPSASSSSPVTQSLQDGARLLLTLSTSTKVLESAFFAQNPKREPLFFASNRTKPSPSQRTRQRKTELEEWMACDHEVLPVRQRLDAWTPPTRGPAGMAAAVGAVGGQERRRGHDPAVRARERPDGLAASTHIDNDVLRVLESVKTKSDGRVKAKENRPKAQPIPTPVPPPPAAHRSRRDGGLTEWMQLDTDVLRVLGHARAASAAAAPRHAPPAVPPSPRPPRK